jgi:hypothetical protein
LSIEKLWSQKNLLFSAQDGEGFDIWERKQKAPKGSFESPWSLHIRFLWKTHFINPPEVGGQVVG